MPDQPNNSISVPGPSGETDDGIRASQAWELTPSRVKEMCDAEENILIIDCRTPNEHVMTRIEGSQLIPLQSVSDHTVETLRGHGGRSLIVYCHHGIRSMKMVTLLREHGITDVFSMAGGIDRWSVEIDPSVARY